MSVSRLLRPLFMITREAYLLRDDFNNTCAAGTVIGTPTTPGPGTRAGTDTNNKLSTGSGVASIGVHTTPAWGDPSMYYPGAAALSMWTRKAGLVNLTRLSLSSTGGKFMYGFGSATTDAINGGEGFYFQAAGVLGVTINSVARNVGVYSAATYYDTAIVWRSPGASFFIRGGAFTTWRLLYVDGTLNTNLYLRFAMGNAAGLVVNLDSVRVPTSVYLLVPLASDSFNRADGALGLTDGAGHTEANGGGGLMWTSQLGTWGINANTAMSSVLDGSGISIATVPCGTPNVVIVVTVARTGNEIGKCLRYVDTDNYLLVQHDGTNCQLIERVGGVNTTRITAAAAIGTGLFQCNLDGASARLFLNGTLIGTYAALVNTTATSHGIFTTNIGNTLDNFVVRATGNEGQYDASLNRWISPN